MKKHGILNSEISKVLADLGHTDRILIGDCGLPIPAGVKKIDLALKLGQPTFIEVLEETLKDMKVEEALLAAEILENNPDVLAEAKALLEQSEISVGYITHEELKAVSKQVKAIIRTGEDTPYANIILQAGVLF